MNYTELVKETAKAACVSQSTAKDVMDSMCDILRSTVESGDEVVLHKVGKFSQKTRSERTGHNPATKEKIIIPASNVVTFKVAKEFKDLINA